jgi:hypothetical protein
VTLLPSMLKSFKRGYRISNELVRHSVLAIATVTGQAIVERTALEIDAAMLTGAATGALPQRLQRLDAGVAYLVVVGEGSACRCPFGVRRH